MAVTNYADDTVSILLGDGSGGFGAQTAFPTSDGPDAVAIGNFDTDLDPDLAVANFNDDTVSILLGDGSGGFGGYSNYFAGDAPTGVAVGDVDADSDLDLALSNAKPGARVGAVAVLLGTPDGPTGGLFGNRKGYGVGTSPVDVAFGDFNADSDPDLAVANLASGGVSVRLGGLDARFSDVAGFPSGSSPRSVVVDDFNGDSVSDLAVAAGDDDVSVRLGIAGSGGSPQNSLTTATEFPAVGNAIGMASGEFNRDSDPDLVVTDQDDDRVSVLPGAAGGSFAAPTAFPVDDPPSVETGDFNSDGELTSRFLRLNADNVSILFNSTFPPPPPTFSGTVPASPANDNAPLVNGSAISGSAVRLYTTPDCSGTPAASGSAAEFPPPGSRSRFRTTPSPPSGRPSPKRHRLALLVELNQPTPRSRPRRQRG